MFAHAVMRVRGFDIYFLMRPLTRSRGSRTTKMLLLGGVVFFLMSVPWFADNKALTPWALWGPTHTRELKAASKLILLTGCRQHNQR